MAVPVRISRTSTDNPGNVHGRDGEVVEREHHLAQGATAQDPPGG